MYIKHDEQVTTFVTFIRKNNENSEFIRIFALPKQNFCSIILLAFRTLKTIFIKGIHLAVRNRRRKSRTAKRQEILIRYFPVWVGLAIIAWMILPTLFLNSISSIRAGLGQLPSALRSWRTNQREIDAKFFTKEVVYWEDDIHRWSENYDVDPNLIATVMQIESCGHPNIASPAGAQGLMQVMPFHFERYENQLDPDTNVMRGANFLNECLSYSNNDIGLTLACYNGGPSVVNRPFHTWASETQRYYIWGLGIYTDLLAGHEQSNTLAEWLQAGGINLCNLASDELNIR